MKKEREGIIWALLTDDERAEMPTPESRQYWLGHKWVHDDGGISGCAPRYDLAYRPRPKPVKKYRPWTPEEAVGKVVRRNDGEARMITGASGLYFAFGDRCYTFEKIVELGYKMLDGSPCGVEVESD